MWPFAKKRNFIVQPPVHVEKLAWTIYSESDPRWRDGGVSRSAHGALIAYQTLRSRFGEPPTDVRVTWDDYEIEPQI
jgi:hypothetical protein